MKTRRITTALLAALSFGAVSVATAQSPAADVQAAKADGEQHRGHGPRGLGGGIDALARLDTDGDGRISREEALAGQQAREARREAHRAERAARNAERGVEAGGKGKARGHHGRSMRGFDLVANFDAIDANGDGYLTRGELRAWHAAKSAERRAEGERRFEAKFREADLNNDGKLSRVEVSEKMPRLAERFAWLDENGDGFLSREELRGARPQR